MRRTKSPGVASAALYRGQEASTAGESAGKTAVARSCPQVPNVPNVPGRPVPRVNLPEAAGRHV